MSAGSIERVRVTELAGIIDELQRVYLAAFSEPPHCEVQEDAEAWISILSDHVEQPGFRMVVARIDGSIVGFIYGHDNVLDGWWWQQVCGDLDADTRARIEASATYTIPELAVDPAHQRRGIARSLHAGLLDQIDSEVTLLTVRSDATRARGLYEGSGWEPIASGPWFGSAPILLMARCSGRGGAPRA